MAPNRATTPGVDQSPRQPAAQGIQILTVWLETFLLQKGGWLGALGMVGLWGAEAVAKGLQKDWPGVAHNLGFLCMAASMTAVLYRGRRNSSMTATGVAEIKDAIPVMTPPSTDPAIRHAEQKVQAAADEMRTAQEISAEIRILRGEPDHDPDVTRPLR